MTELLVVLGAVATYMCALYACSLLLKNNGVADVGYGIAFIVAVFTSLWLEPALTWQLMVLVALLCVWGIRLVMRIGLKNYGKPEDFRYRAWRESWGKSFLLRSFLQIYMLQGLIAYAIALPITLSILFAAPEVLSGYFWAGMCIWIIGFVFESVSDYQLDAFLRNPQNRGKIMMGGLWKYSRHPNYFGESLIWSGVAIAAFSMTTYPMFVWISPVLITFLLLKVSGVPLLEKRWQGNAEWEVYKKRTSVFIPLPPKSR
jgi:steroid 5-alpha reductase family enzyme